MLQVKLWGTINEAWTVCYGYGNKYFAPGIGKPAVAPYMVGHNILRAHGKTYRMYNAEFRSKQKGNINVNAICFTYAYMFIHSTENFM